MHMPISSSALSWTPCGRFRFWYASKVSIGVFRYNGRISDSVMNAIKRSMARSPLCLQLLGEQLAELGHLRVDHGHAIALRRVSGEVLLVIVLGDVEGLGGDDLGDDGVVEDLVLREG